jgi:hypothetical protein
MKISNLFKKNSKKKEITSFQKIEEKQLNKVLGGSGTRTGNVIVMDDNKVV